MLAIGVQLAPNPLSVFVASRRQDGLLCDRGWAAQREPVRLVI
jgi:hypothetical protein